MIGIYESTTTGFTMVTPVFNQTFLFDVIGLFLVIVLLQVGLGLWKWVKGRWSYAFASYNLVYNLASATFIIWMASSPRLFDTRFLAFWRPCSIPSTGSGRHGRRRGTISGRLPTYKKGAPRK